MENKNTGEHEMMGMLSALAETKKRNFGKHKQVYVQDEKD